MATAYIVRYGSTRLLGEFTPKDAEVRYRRGMDVIVRTDRGLEVGHVLCEVGEGNGARHLASGIRGQILRRMTADDRLECRRLAEGARSEFEVCRRYIERRKLPMQLVDVEHLFGGERIIFYFMADGRVDFRELVKDLAREYQTRIEMRQIGVRDEAKLLADYGDCGLPCCCNSYMAEMPPVSMKMAKMQKATLDPAKISGRCGRLKCCLRFEDECYERLRQELPEVGSRVRTAAGVGEVVGQEILAQRVAVEYEDKRRLVLTRREILEVIESPRAGTGKRKRQGQRRGPEQKTPSAAPAAVAEPPSPEPPSSEPRPAAPGPDLRPPDTDPMPS